MHINIEMRAICRALSYCDYSEREGWWSRSENHLESDWHGSDIIPAYSTAPERTAGIWAGRLTGERVMVEMKMLLYIW